MGARIGSLIERVGHVEKRLREEWEAAQECEYGDDLIECQEITAGHIEFLSARHYEVAKIKAELMDLDGHVDTLIDALGDLK